mgnify:CR=1 FL=1
MSIFTNPILNTTSVLTPSVVVNSVMTPYFTPLSPYFTPLSPIITTRPYLSVYPSVVTNPYPYNNSFYYDSGVGENPHTQHEINNDIRYKFLDKYLHEDYPEILRMLKVSNGTVHVLSSSEAEKNDISKDTDSILEDKVDFIGSDILTYYKNQKILYSIVHKYSGIKFYDLPHNTYYVKKEQAKYVKKKLKEMRK